MRYRCVNVAYILFAVQCLEGHVAVSALSQRSAISITSRTCTDTELADYALLVAVGPAQPPRCTPAAGQVLSAPDFDLASQLAVLQPVHGNVTKVDSKKQRVREEKDGTYFTHLHVVQSGSKWCPLPCDSPSWELNAPKPKKGSPYLLLEAAIWRQFRKVVLYQFDEEWEKLARNSYAGLCGGKAWGCEAYEKHR